MIPVLPQSSWQPGTQGLFHLPEEVYRHTVGCNQSILKKVLRSPAHAREEFLNPPEPTPAMILGQLTHVACLEPEKFGDGKSHHNKPVGMTFTTKDGRAWREEHQDLPILTPEDASAITGMSIALAQHPLACRIQTTGVSEVCAFVTHPDTGLLLKCKLDKVFRDDQGKLWIADLKTTDDAREFERSAVNFGYDFQAAYYLDILTGIGLEIEGFVFVAVEKTAPHGLICYQADHDVIDRGRRLYQRALRIYSECLRDGKWPSYPADVLALRVPGWVKD